MPETAVDEDYCEITGKDQIGFTWIAFVTDTVTQTGLEKGRTDLFFGLRVFSADVGHGCMTLVRS